MKNHLHITHFVNLIKYTVLVIIICAWVLCFNGRFVCIETVYNFLKYPNNVDKTHFKIIILKQLQLLYLVKEGEFIEKWRMSCSK